MPSMCWKGTRQIFPISTQIRSQLAVMAHAYNQGTWALEAGGLGVQGQPGLHSEALPHKRNKQETSLVLVTGFKPIKLKNMYL